MKYDLHMISFKRKGENSYFTLHKGEKVTPEIYQILSDFLKSVETEPVEEECEFA